MLAVGLTGGIGAGKSTVAGLLVERGAAVVDADRIAREVVEPSGPAYEPLVERFGSRIVSDDGTLDRKALASLAFADPEELAALNAITHPAIGAEMLRQRKAYEGSHRIVLLDIPLLRSVHRELLTLDVVVVVDCPVDLAIERLVTQRGFDLEDARARVDAQMSRADRTAGADFVIDNSKSRAWLVSQVEKLWSDLVHLERDKTVRGAGSPKP